jgi:hypothetical protein
MLKGVKSCTSSSSNPSAVGADLPDWLEIQGTPSECWSERATLDADTAMMTTHTKRPIWILTLVFSVVFLPAALTGQSLHIAAVSMSPLGSTQRSYSTFSAVASRFDVVAADDVRDPGGMEKVLAGMDEGWEASVSRGGSFGFLYSERVQMVKELGTYPGESGFAQPPYGAQFRLAGCRFALNLVLCHVVQKDSMSRAAEIAGLSLVYRYFENLTGNRGITLLLAGGLGNDRERAARLLAERGDVVLLRSSDRIFASTALRPRIEKAGTDPSTPPAAYIVLRTGK